MTKVSSVLLEELSGKLGKGVVFRQADAGSGGGALQDRERECELSSVCGEVEAGVRG